MKTVRMLYAAIVRAALVDPVGAHEPTARCGGAATVVRNIQPRWTIAGREWTCWAPIRVEPRSASGNANDLQDRR
jgi:hypothetical protein